MALGSTQPLTKISTWSISGGKGGRCLRLTTLPPSYGAVMKSGNINFLEPSGPLQTCNGTALPLLSFQKKKRLPPSSVLIMDPTDLSQSSVNFYTPNLIPKHSNFQSRFWEWAGRTKMRKKRRRDWKLISYTTGILEQHINCWVYAAFNKTSWDKYRNSFWRKCFVSSS